MLIDIWNCSHPISEAYPHEVCKIPDHRQEGLLRYQASQKQAVVCLTIVVERKVSKITSQYFNDSVRELLIPNFLAKAALCASEYNGGSCRYSN